MLGDREKGALLGAGAVVLLGGLINASQQTRYVETQTYYEPRPTVVYREPVYVQERVIYIDNPLQDTITHHVITIVIMMIDTTALTDNIKSSKQR